jgi:hypothetical protein
LALATVAMLGAAGVADSVTTASAEGRNAVRVLGRPALRVPGWTVRASSEARWTSRDLDWGPAYEPHRYWAGVRLGGRLPLARGAYDLILEAEMPPGSRPPLLEVRGEGRATRPRAVRLESVAGGWGGRFEVLEGERAVSLLLKGGGPFRLLTVRVSRSTF